MGYSFDTTAAATKRPITTATLVRDSVVTVLMFILVIILFLSASSTAYFSEWGKKPIFKYRVELSISMLALVKKENEALK